MIFYVDGDSCPVKDIVHKVTVRYELETIYVAAQNMAVRSPIQFVRVGGNFNEADDWIVEKVQAGDLVATNDIELADRALQKKAFAINFNGKEFTEDNIGPIKGSRDLNAVIRDTALGVETKHKPRSSKDKSNFAQEINNLIQKIKNREEKLKKLRRD